MTDIAVIVLAAGKGTRMKSELPKVLHRAAGRSLLGHVLHTAKAMAPSRTVVVSGPDMPGIEIEARKIVPGATVVVQHERKGTGHAVSVAQPALEDFSGTVLVLYGDAPLVSPERLEALSATGRNLAVLGFQAADPTGYGRLILDPDGFVSAIREELDASSEQRKIKLCNSGIISVSSTLLWKLLPRLGSGNAKGEFYLTDIVELAAAGGENVAMVEGPEADFAGVNDRVQLAAVESEMQGRYRRQHMLNGATLVAPETVFFAADTVVGRDVVIEPHVTFGPGVTISDNVEILGFCHFEGASVAAGARVGPFARLRPGAEIGADAHIGNFVEVKKSVIGKGAKANHLTYIGDAKVGAGSNIGAGSITCNYDGFEKRLTDIGPNVFVGSNTAMVAPVAIGEGAYIAAGSVITKDVPANALASTRAPLEMREGWAAKYREIKRARKATKSKA